MIQNPSDIEVKFVSYFEDIFNYNNSYAENGLIEDTISPLVNNSMNAMPINLPSFEEVRNAVFGMNHVNAHDLMVLVLIFIKSIGM